MLRDRSDDASALLGSILVSLHRDGGIESRQVTVDWLDEMDKARSLQVLSSWPEAPLAL
jgi:hypothetical protein